MSDTTLREYSIEELMNPQRSSEEEDNLVEYSLEDLMKPKDTPKVTSSDPKGSLGLPEETLKVSDEEAEKLYSQFNNVSKFKEKEVVSDKEAEELYSQFKETPKVEREIPEYNAEHMAEVRKAHEEANPFRGDYGPNDLIRPDRLQIVDKYLKERHGLMSLDKIPPKDRVKMFLKNMRYYQANVPSTVSTLSHIMSTDDKGRQIMHDGFELFEKMRGFDDKGNTVSNTLEAMRDYTVGAVFDPVNLVGGIIGKTFSNGATKPAQLAARKVMAESLAKGASEKVARSTALKTFGRVLQESSKQQALSTSTKAVAIATGVDSAVSVGQDLAMQKGLVLTGNQEEINKVQTGLAALGGLVVGGVVLGGEALKGASKLPLASATIRRPVITVTKDLEGALTEVVDSTRKAKKKVPFKSPFKTKVVRGEELDAVDTDFWSSFILGNDDEGIVGLATTLKNQGFVYEGVREEGDNFTNWMADALRHSPEEDKKAFVKLFEDEFKVKIGGKDPASQLADSMSRKISDSGRALRLSSMARQELGIKENRMVTPDEYVEYLFGPSSKVGEEVRKGVGEKVGFLQNQYISLLVSNPGTSALNITGWGFKSTAQSAADLTRGLLHIPYSTLKGSPDVKPLVNAVKANKRKMLNLLDPTTTREAFQSYVSIRETQLKGLTEVLPGGVVRTDVDILGLPQTGVGKMEKSVGAFTNFAQHASGVKAQDVFTKSQEFMYNLDSVIREFGIADGYIDLLKRKDAAKIMASDKYLGVEAKAVEYTLENIFSKSYSKAAGNKMPIVSEFATAVEGLRTVPVVGTLVPFGKFFNNSMATMVEYSPASPILRMMAGNTYAKGKTAGELFSKAVVGTTAVGLMVSTQMDNIEKGISWDTTRSELTGSLTDQRYTAPYTYMLAGARLLAHQVRGETPPEELLTDMSKAVGGQMFRGLTEGEQIMSDITTQALQADPEVFNTILEVAKATPATLTAGSTRFLEPVNTVVALSGDKEDYIVVDTQQGAKNTLKAFRYIDQLVFDVSELPERQSPTSRVNSRNPSKLFGSREAGPISDAQRVLAMVGKPDWNVDINADSKEARALVNEVFNPIFEDKAKDLLANEFFLEASIKEKKVFVKRALADARKGTHDFLINSPDMNNVRLEKLFKLTSENKISDLQKALDELGIEKTPEELNPTELNGLKDYLDDEDDRLLRGAYSK